MTLQKFLHSCLLVTVGSRKLLSIAAVRIKPKIVIPIHDAIIKDFMLERLYQNLLAPLLRAQGIRFHPLGPGQEINV